LDRPMIDYQAAFQNLIQDPRYLANLDWGKPRHGHPEGTVRAHIAELEANLEALRPRLVGDEYWKLKLLIHAHDSFKAEAESGVAITNPRSHASLARSFLATHCPDPDLLTMVQYHDEPYALYRQSKSRGHYDSTRFQELLEAICDWNVFMAFSIIDGCTAGKSRKPLLWLFNEVSSKVESRFTADDIIA
jgi:hypothetical protein